MAYEISYPVLFEAGGDTTRDAFSKHIQEFVAVYGILNELKKADISESELDSLKNGNINASRITGTMDASHISGTIAGSKISGAMPNATIASGNVTGLEAFVKKLLPSDDGGNNYGISECSVNANGYAKFGNGLMVQWGSAEIEPGSDYQTGDINFPKSFNNACYSVMLTCIPSSGAEFNKNRGVSANLVKQPTVSGFRAGIIPLQSSSATIYYIAIGA